ncbi:MAG TPA: hypothetical protein VM888_09150, partial [Chitinophagaceae bacterium]|nr:hypothetical protein [Chitinophagaceae bacterium]
DRFWVWVHYAILKIGRGEYIEAVDFFGFLRMVVLGPLLHIKNGNRPRGVRKVEMKLMEEDYEQLLQTIPTTSKASLLYSLRRSILLYQHLRNVLFPIGITLQSSTEKRVMLYFDEIEKQ